MALRRYTVAQAGFGARGEVHVKGILENSDRLELAAVCDIDQAKLAQKSGKYGISKTYTDANAMLADVKPDVFVFVTNPDLRLGMVELAAKHKVKALAFEKPMAMSLKEASLITRLCEENGIKATVSHQQKYLTSMQKLKSIVDSGKIGGIVQINISTQGWMSQIGTHFMDYAMWVNNWHKAEWAAGHVHGKKALSYDHPSPDYIMGQAAFSNGVRLFMENGYLSKSTVKAENFWVDNRLTVYGSNGYAWAETDGAWGACVSGEIVGGQGGTWAEQEPGLQTAYFRDMIKWLDDDSYAHPCSVSNAYHGYEIIEAMCLSALDNRPVHFPVDPDTMPDVIARMRAELS